ncbi:MATE family efflux transporter [uncultured Tyzzerella sp.]|uniref:MATE family efflux transporter n=1 Tax=uncultured Tyzzerella sp. TaxID=2321398 RepID=UPI0029433A6C|nr:MATE family efflux transporter [uncultured Tyzzerella sp.]
MENKFKVSQVFKLVLPTTFMMSFMSLYTIVDGAFVSRFVGTDALSAVNIAYPYVNFLLGVSIMLGTGGCALVMKKIGEKRNNEAKKDFSLIVYFTFILSILIMFLSLVFIEQILKILQAEGSLYKATKEYLFYMIVFATPTMLKYIVEQFLVAINKSKTALILSVSGGILNIILDYVFIVLFKFGVKGAAIATGIGYAVPAIIGLWFFIKKSNLLHFKMPSKNISVILSSCSNGSSEMVSQLSSGIITFLFNFVMLKYIGEDGVAAITIILYIQYLVTSIFLGYSIGVSPKISYFYGSKDIPMLKSLISISIKLVLAISIFSYIIITISSPLLIRFFTEPNTNVYSLTLEGLKIYSLSFLIVGMLIFVSGMFTSFSNGKVSAIISFLRALVFESTGIILFPMLIGISGVWWSVPIASLLCGFVCFYFYKKYKPIYNY